MCNETPTDSERTNTLLNLKAKKSEIQRKKAKNNHETYTHKKSRTPNLLIVSRSASLFRGPERIRTAVGGFADQNLWNPCSARESCFTKHS